MSSETEQPTEGWISLWQALCWMAYDDYDAVPPPVGNNMSNDEELGAIWDLIEAKNLFLSNALAGHARTRGRRGVRYRAPVGASWAKYEWFGHDDKPEEINQTDWPADKMNPVLSWERGTLKTPNAEYIDVEVEEAGLRAWWSATYLATEAEATAADADRSTPKRLDADARVKGGKAPKYNPALQHFINYVSEEFEESGDRLTLNKLKTWLEKNAQLGEGFEFDDSDCDDIEYVEDKVWWKDSSGRPKSLTIRSIEPYIRRARQPASTERT